MKKLHANNRGFTLIELVMMIVIVGIMAFAVIPKMGDLRSIGRDKFFDEVVAALRYGQELAVSTGCQVRVNLSGSGYSLYQRSSCDTSSPFSIAVQHPGSSGDFQGSCPSGVTISPAQNVIFGPLGTADFGSSAPSLTVTVGGQSFKLWAESGYVEIL